MEIKSCLSPLVILARGVVHTYLFVCLTIVYVVDCWGGTTPAGTGVLVCFIRGGGLCRV